MQRANPGPSAMTAEKPASSSKASIVTTAATTVAATSGFLSLLGYGVALSVNDLLIPHYGATSSPFEFLQLAFLALGYMAKRMVAMPWSRTFDLGSIECNAWVFVAMFALALVVYYVAALRRGGSKRRELSVRQRLRRYFVPAGLPSIGWALSRATVGSVAATSLGAVIMAAAGLLIYLVLYLGIALVALVPMLGLRAGRDYITEYVVAPTSCAPLKPRAKLLSSELPSERRASCVVVCKDSTVLGYGRVVFGTSSSLALYDPNTGDAERVPVGDTVIRAVESLENVDADACRAATSAPRISTAALRSELAGGRE